MEDGPRLGHESHPANPEFIRNSPPGSARPQTLQLAEELIEVGEQVHDPLSTISSFMRLIPIKAALRRQWRWPAVQWLGGVSANR